jgi:aerobic C4-dicarboxylate transport protein
MTNTLAAALFLVPDIPIQSIAILVGIDKSMSECRALTILIGNNVACFVISLLEVELDKDKPHETMGQLEPGARELLYTGSKAHLHINCHARIA